MNKINNVVSTPRFLLFKEKMLSAKKSADPQDAVLSLCVKESQSLRKKFDNLTTLRRYYTFYRNICRDVLDEQTLAMSLEIMNLTQAEILSLFDQYKQKVATKHRDLRPLKNHDEMILKAQSLLDAPSIYDRILALACLTGRRVAEIGCTAQFQTLKGDWMLFDGQLKGKTRIIGKYEIPVLTEGTWIVEAIKSVREKRPLWKDNTILFHDCGSRELSLRVKRHFTEFIDNPAVKDLRAAYAEVCYYKFGDVRTAKARFFSDILGHGQDDITTGQSYLDFYIVD